MTYNPNIPLPVPSPATQQSGIKTNFSQLASEFSSTFAGGNLNHSPFNSSNQGKHEAIILQDNITDPGVTNNYVALYNKAGQLFAQIPQFLPNGIPNSPMQLTYGQVNTTGPAYQSFLVGGYILYIGTSVKATLITLSPACSQLIIAIASPKTNNLYDVGTTLTQPNKFTINSTLAPGAYSFSYMAIGKQ